jgi:hypothetical protein
MEAKRWVCANGTHHHHMNGGAAWERQKDGVIAVMSAPHVSNRLGLCRRTQRVDVVLRAASP